MPDYVSTPRRIEALAKLTADYAWPSRRPAVPENKEHGWLDPATMELLSAVLTPESRLVVELGSWLGLSTRFIADRAPQATVVAIDHWRGSPEHLRNPEWAAMIDGLYETFLVNCWEYRPRLLPLRVSTLDGLCILARRGLEPDVIYMDADHSFEAVKADFECALELFPGAVIVGDDWGWKSVRDGVLAVSDRRGVKVEVHGYAWRTAAPCSPR